jgi:hypothetical protein
MVGRIEHVLELLNDAGVRYLVVGGVAVVLHGHLRTTADLDLVLDLAPDNVRAAVAALAVNGFRPRAPVKLEDFADPATRRSWIDEKNLEVFSLWHPDIPGFEVDLFVTVPFDFNSVYGRKIELPIERTIAPVIGLADLIELKQAAGRHRDLEDVKALQVLSKDGTDG